MKDLQQEGELLKQQPDEQLSLTDPDARSMATSGRGTGMVGYNVQIAADTTHHLIVAHDVLNVGHDRSSLSSMAEKSQDALGRKGIGVLADRGYYSGPEILAAERAGVNTYVPKPMTSNSKARGRFAKNDFVYIAKLDQYRCPAGERLHHGFDVIENGLTIGMYAKYACGGCRLKEQCTTGNSRKVSRWEHEDVLDEMQRRLDGNRQAMKIRKRTVEHVFGTLKHWMGSTHFQTRRLAGVGTEISLHILAYNLKRVMQLLGMSQATKAMRLAGA